MSETSSVDGRESVRRPALRSLVVAYLKGLAMGAADAVPGVSGGTIALITGIYERVIRALTSLEPSVLRFVPRLHRRTDRLAFVDAILRMDLPFLVALGLGMVSAVAILSRFVEAALETVPALTFAFFFGLIAASAVVLYEREWFSQPRCIAAAVAGFTVAFVIAGASGNELLSHSLPVIFVAGMLAISGMVLPGISGAFILLLVGQYGYMSGTLNDFIDSLLSVLGGNGVGTLVAETTVVGTFMLGAFTGLFTVAYAVRAALERYRTATLTFLVSLMVGALRLPMARVVQETGRWTAPNGASIVAVATVGALLVLILDRYTDDIDYDA